jgi:uncharacterized membrane protein YhfC
MNNEKRTFLSKNAFFIFLTSVFTIGSIVYARFYYPELSWFGTIVGSIAFGIFSMICATSIHFFE